MALGGEVAGLSVPIPQFPALLQLLRRFQRAVVSYVWNEIHRGLREQPGTSVRVVNSPRSRGGDRRQRPWDDNMRNRGNTRGKQGCCIS